MFTLNKGQLASLQRVDGTDCCSAPQTGRTPHPTMRSFTPSTQTTSLLFPLDVLRNGLPVLVQELVRSHVVSYYVVQSILGSDLVWTTGLCVPSSHKVPDI